MRMQNPRRRDSAPGYNSLALLQRSACHLISELESVQMLSLPDSVPGNLPV